MRPIYKIIIGLGVVGVASYTIAYFLRQAQLLQNISTNFKGVKTNNVSANNVSLTVTEEIVNVSDINFTITGVDIDIYANGVNTAKALMVDDTVDVPAKGSGLLVLDIEIDPSDALKAIGKAVSVLNLSGMSFRLLGSCNVKSGGLMFNNIPIDTSFTLASILTT